MSAQERLKWFYESALFEQKPFRYTVQHELFKTDEKTCYITTYEICDDAGKFIYLANFEKAEDFLNKTKVYFYFQTAEGDMSVTNDSKDIVFRLFTTIISIMKDYMGKNTDFVYLFFTSDIKSPSRVKLYDALISKFKNSYSSEYYFQQIESGRLKKYYIARKSSNYNPITRKPWD